MRAFSAFYLLAAYPPSPFIGASREVAGSPCFPIFPPEGKDVRAAREQSSEKRYLFGCRGRSCYGRRNTRLCRRMIDGDRLLASAFKRHETFLKRRPFGLLRVRVRASPDTNIADRKAGIRIDRYAFYCFDFFGARFFGPVPMDDSASSPWQGQASLNASIATVIPGSFTRSGLLSIYRRKTLALCKMLPCVGGHARTPAGRFGEKSIAVSIIPSQAPADRASS